MFITKTTMLAAGAALTLGAGVAQAQSLVPGDSEGAYYRTPTRTVTQQSVQSGSSDMVTTRAPNPTFSNGSQLTGNLGGGGDGGGM